MFDNIQRTPDVVMIGMKQSVRSSGADDVFRLGDVLAQRFLFFTRLSCG